MELISALKEAILKPLQSVNGIVERRHAIPILSNIVLRKEGASVSMLASGSEIQITTSAEIGSGDGSAATTVSPSRLIEILRALPDNTEVSLVMNDQRITVKAGRSVFQLQAMNADDYPAVLKKEEFAPFFTISQKDLKAVFSLLSFSMAAQDIRYYLNGLLLRVSGSTLTSVATDGHRLSMCETVISASGEAGEVIVPRRAVLELMRLLGDTDEPVVIERSANQIRFEFSGLEVISKLVDGRYPDFTKVIPKGYNNSFTLSRVDTQRALQRLAILTSEKSRGVRCLIDNGLFQISCKNNEQEEGLEELDISYNGQPIDTGFNVSYLLDLVNNVPSEKLTIDIGDSNSSALITLSDIPSFKYVVMPMRI